MIDLNEQLRECAFCGSAPVLKRIGNDHTKTRAVQVKCSNVECRVERTDKALRHDLDWLESVAIKNWNRRATPAPQAAPSDESRAFTKPEGWINLANPGQTWEEWTREQGAPTTKGWRVAAAPAVAITQAATSEPVAMPQVELDASLDTWMDVEPKDVPTWQRKGFNVRTLYAAPVAHLAGTTPNTEAPSEGSISAIDVEQLQARLDALLDYPEGSIGAALEEKCFLSWREKHVNRPGWEDTDLFIYRKGLVDGKRAGQVAQPDRILDAEAVRAIRRAVRYLEENECTGPAADLKALLDIPSASAALSASSEAPRDECAAFDAWLAQGNGCGANHSLRKGWMARAALSAQQAGVQEGPSEDAKGERVHELDAAMSLLRVALTVDAGKVSPAALRKQVMESVAIAAGADGEGEEYIYADVYGHLCELIEPYVLSDERPEGYPFTASVTDTMSMLIEHYQRTAALAAAKQTEKPCT